MLKIAAAMTDPVILDGRGPQDREGVLATLHLRQRKWPDWKEVPVSLRAKRVGDAVVVVEVVSRYMGTSPGAQQRISEELETAYTVTFDAQARPLISQVERLEMAVSR
jgi:hypothetical protein